MTTTKATLTEFKTYMATERQAGDNDARLSACLDAASTACDQWTQRVIEVAGSGSARSYKPTPGSNWLPIHDCTTVTTVVENGTTLTVDVGYQREPVGAINAAGETVPYSGLYRLDATWYTRPPRATVVVTATWGWATIPPPVKQACLMLAKDIATARERTGDVAGFGEFGVVRLRQSPQISGLLAPYRRVEAWGIG